MIDFDRHVTSWCYPHFNVFSTRKGLLCKFFYIFWVEVSALLLSFLKAFLDNSTRREVWAAGKSMLCVAKAFSRHKVPREIDRLRNELRYQSFSTAVKPPWFPEVGTHKESKHILSTTPGGQISDQKSLYAPIIPLSVPGPGGWGFQLTSALS